MKILKLFVILLLFVGVVRVSNERVLAEDPCQEACSNTYTSCLQDDQEQWETCVNNVLLNFNICTLAAEQNYESCQIPCNGQTACLNMCYDQEQQAFATCLNNSLEAGANCDSASGTRQAFCQNQYNACVNSCSP